MSVSISKSMLHILDPSVGMPVLSESFMSLDEHMREYTEKHIQKCFNDQDLKKTKFINEDGFFLKHVKAFIEKNDLKIFSVNISEFFYKLISENPDIQNCDL